MPLSNVELFDKFEAILEAKFDKKFSDLYAEISGLKETNEKLIEINKALISQNKDLRLSLSGSSQSDVFAEDIDSVKRRNYSVADEEDDVDVYEERDDGKEFYDCLLLSDSIYRHIDIMSERKVRPWHASR